MHYFLYLNLPILSICLYSAIMTRAEARGALRRMTLLSGGNVMYCTES